MVPPERRGPRCWEVECCQNRLLSIDNAENRHTCRYVTTKNPGKENYARRFQFGGGDAGETGKDAVRLEAGRV